MELKTYSDWSLENNEADPAERIRNYADYVRTTNFKSGGLNAEVEQGITDGVAQLALKEGIVTGDMAEEEFKGIVGDLRSSKKHDADTDAKLLLDHYTLDRDPLDPEVAAKAAPLRRYLTMRRMSPELVEADGVLDAVNPLLSDADSIRAARKAAVDRGDLQLVAVEEADGTRQIYTGSGTTREMVTGKLDALLASGAIRPGDLPEVEDNLRPLFGGATTVAEFNRGRDFASTFDELAKKDPTLRESLQLDANDLRQSNENALRSTGETVWHNTKKGAISVFDTLVATPVKGIFGTLTDAVGLTEDQGLFADKKAKPYVPRNVVERLSQNEAIRNAFTPEEIEKFGSSLVQRAAGPAYRADRPGSGIAVDAMGSPMIAPALIPNKVLFDKELESSALNEEQKAAARLSREGEMDNNTPAYIKQISEEDGAAASALAQHRATGGSDTEFVEKWLGDPANYSGFSERAQQLGATVAGVIPQLALAIPSLLGHEGSTKAIIAMQKDQQDRQQYAQLFGDEFGMGFDILNTIPQVATDVLATIGTGAVYAGAKGVMRGGVRAASRAAIKSTVGTVSREAAMLTKGAAAAGGEGSIGIAFQNLGKEIATKLSTVEKLAPAGAVAFTRSAGASYASIYNQLDPKLTHAEKHEKAVGYAVATGIGTALTVMGMSFLGRGGVEDLATRRIRPGSWGDDVIDDATQTVKATGVRNIPLGSLNYKQAKQLYESTFNASKALPDGAFQAALRKNIGNAWKNYFRTTLKGGWDEGLEESIDQGIQMKLEDAALDRETPLADKIDQYWKAFVLGGAMGAGSAGVSQLVRPLNRNEVGVALDARMTLLSKTAADLRKTGSNATAASLERELGRYRQIAGERAAKEAAERAKLEADKAAGVKPETPTEKRFYWDQEDFQKDTFLTDLDGSVVTYDGQEGYVRVEGPNAYFEPARRNSKGKIVGQEVRIDPKTKEVIQGTNKFLLGDRMLSAAGIVTNTPSFPVDESGMMYVTSGNKNLRLPVPGSVSPDQFTMTYDEKGNVEKVNLPGLFDEKNPDRPANKWFGDRYIINRLAKIYGLDITPKPELARGYKPPAPEKPAEFIKVGGDRKTGDLVQGALPFVKGKGLPEPAFVDPLAEPALSPEQQEEKDRQRAMLADNPDQLGLTFDRAQSELNWAQEQRGQITASIAEMEQQILWEQQAEIPNKKLVDSNKKEIAGLRERLSSVEAMLGSVSGAPGAVFSDEFQGQGQFGFLSRKPGPLPPAPGDVALAEVSAGTASEIPVPVADDANQSGLDFTDPATLLVNSTLSSIDGQIASLEEAKDGLRVGKNATKEDVARVGERIKLLKQKRKSLLEQGESLRGIYQSAEQQLPAGAASRSNAGAGVSIDGMMRQFEALSEDTESLADVMRATPEKQVTAIEDYIDEAIRFLGNSDTGEQPDVWAAIERLDNLRASMDAAKARVADSLIDDDVAELEQDGRGIELLQQMLVRGKIQRGTAGLAVRSEPYQQDVDPDLPVIMDEVEEPDPSLEEIEVPVTPPVSLDERINKFMDEVSAYAASVKSMRERKTDSVFMMEADRKKRSAKISREIGRITKVVNEMGLELYNEIVNSETLEYDAQTRMIEDMKARMRRTYNQESTLASREPILFFEEYRKWQGTPEPINQKSGEARTEGERKLLKLLADNGHAPSSLQQWGASWPGIIKHFSHATPNTTYTPFSNARVDLTENGGGFTDPTPYLQSKEAELKRKVQTKFPPLWEVNQETKTMTYGKSKRRSDYRRVPAGVQDISKHLNKVQYRKVRGVWVPVIEESVGGRFETFGVFTNDIEITMRQVDSSWPIIGVPAGFDSDPTRNPSINIRDGRVTGYWAAHDLDRSESTMIPYGQRLRPNAAGGNTAASERLSVKNKARTALFGGQSGVLWGPAEIDALMKQLGEITSVNKRTGQATGLHSFKAQMLRNLERAKPDTSLPTTEAAVEKAWNEITDTFGTRFTEYVLARRVTRSVLGTLRERMKTDPGFRSRVKAQMSFTEAEVSWLTDSYNENRPAKFWHSYKRTGTRVESDVTKENAAQWAEVRKRLETDAAYRDEFMREAGFTEDQLMDFMERPAVPSRFGSIKEIAASSAEADIGALPLDKQRALLARVDGLVEFLGETRAANIIMDGMPKGLDRAEVAKALVAIYPELDPKNPEAALNTYAQMLFTGSVRVDGAFHTPPTAVTFAKEAGTIMERNRGRERRDPERGLLVSLNAAASSGFTLEDMAFDLQAGDVRADQIEDAILRRRSGMDAFSEEDLQEMARDRVVEAWSVANVFDAHTRFGRALMIGEELYQLVDQSQELAETFRELAREFDPAFADIAGGRNLVMAFVNKLGASENMNSARDLLLRLAEGRLPEGRRVAALLIANNWLPPVHEQRIDPETGRLYTIRHDLMTPSMAEESGYGGIPGRERMDTDTLIEAGAQAAQRVGGAVVRPKTFNERVPAEYRKAYLEALNDPEVVNELRRITRQYSRITELKSTTARNMARALGNLEVLVGRGTTNALRREDLRESVIEDAQEEARVNVEALTNRITAEIGLIDTEAGVLERLADEIGSGRVVSTDEIEQAAKAMRQLGDEFGARQAIMSDEQAALDDLRLAEYDKAAARRLFQIHGPERMRILAEEKRKEQAALQRRLDKIGTMSPEQLVLDMVRVVDNLLTDLEALATDSTGPSQMASKMAQEELLRSLLVRARQVTDLDGYKAWQARLKRNPDALSAFYESGTVTDAGAMIRPIEKTMLQQMRANRLLDPEQLTTDPAIIDVVALAESTLRAPASAPITEKDATRAKYGSVEWATAVLELPALRQWRAASKSIQEQRLRGTPAALSPATQLRGQLEDFVEELRYLQLSKQYTRQQETDFAGFDGTRMLVEEAEGLGMVVHPEGGVMPSTMQSETIQPVFREFQRFAKASGVEVETVDPLGKPAQALLPLGETPRWLKDYRNVLKVQAFNRWVGSLELVEQEAAARRKAQGAKKYPDMAKPLALKRLPETLPRRVREKDGWGGAQRAKDADAILKQGKTMKKAEWVDMVQLFLRLNPNLLEGDTPNPVAVQLRDEVLAYEAQVLASRAGEWEAYASRAFDALTTPDPKTGEAPVQVPGGFDPTSPAEVMRQTQQITESLMIRYTELYGNLDGPENAAMRAAFHDKVRDAVGPVLEAKREYEKLRQRSKMAGRPANVPLFRGGVGDIKRSGAMPQGRRVSPTKPMGYAPALSVISPELRDEARALNKADMAELGLVDGQRESMMTALRQMSRKGTPLQKLVSKLLLAQPGLMSMLDIRIVDMENSMAGLYDVQTNTIILNLAEHTGRGLGDVLLHELVHATTLHILRNPATRGQQEAIRRLDQIRAFAAMVAQRNGVDSPDLRAALSSNEELLSYALTSPEVQQLLTTLRVPEQRSVWARLVDAILSLFDITPGETAVRDAFEELMDFTQMSMAHNNSFSLEPRRQLAMRERRERPLTDAAIRDVRVEDGRFAPARSRFQYRIDEQTLGDGSTQFTIYFDNKVEDVRVVDADMVGEVRDALNDQIFGEVTPEDIANFPTRFALASGALVPGGLSINPIRELEAMLPPGMTIVQDDKMLGVMGTRRGEPTVLRVNGRLLPGEMLRGLKPDKARAVLRATLDEELAELAADSVMTDDDYTGLAASLEDSQRSNLENSYFGVMLPDAKERAAKIAELRETGQWTDADLGREWFRQHVTRMALGSTREQVLEYKDSNPGLFTKIVDAIARYIEALRNRLAEVFTNGTAARISQASRELRRLRNDGVLPDPERAPAGEYGDATAFLNMLDNNEVPGQEDRTRFALPVYGEDAKVGGFWKAVRSRFYDMAHPELKAILDIKGGTNKAVEYTMKEFNRRFPKMRDAALSAGFSLEDIMLTFGTTAPMVSADERVVINKQLKAEGLGWKKAQFDKDVKAARDTRERVLYDDAARRMASAFRIQQQAMEDRMRADGFGEMVDFIIENRNVLNRYKMQIGFGETNDVYLTRTYRYFKTPAWAAAVKAGSVFTDPETGESVDFGALRRIAADEMYKEEVLKNAKKDGERLTDTEVAERVMAKLDAYLLDLDKRAETSQTLDGVVMLRKDLNLLKTKKDLDFPLRHLLGEVKDPFETYLRTLYNVSRYASNEQFLQDFTDKAIELGLASYTPTDGMELLFPARKELEYDKLAGLHVRKDIANAIRDEFLHKGPSSEPNGQALITKAFTRPAAWISGASIFAKTSLGIGYWARNMMSNMLLTTAQGINPFSFQAFKAFHMARLANIDALSNNSTEAEREHIRRLTELQIVRDDVTGRMALDLMKGFAAGTEQQLDDMLKAITQAQVTGDMGLIKKAWTGTKIPAAFNWLVEGTANLNNFVDSFPKINAYYQELASLRKSYGDTKSDAELEALAARKVKLTFPTHSQQFSAVKAFNRSPLGLAIIPFLRWKTEVVRTMINTPALIKEEMQSGNANEVWRGTKRLIGFTGTVGGAGSGALGAMYMGVNAIFQSLAGDDEEDAEVRALTAEEKADIRLGLPDWQREHDFVARVVGNRIQMVDMTYALPHSMVTDLVKLATEGVRTGRDGSLDSLARYISGEVLGANIAFSAAIETATNSDDFGNKIALETDSVPTKVAKLLTYYAKGTVAPSSYVKYKAVTRPGETKRAEMILGELLGGRAVFQDTPIIAERVLRRLKNTQDEAVALRQVIQQGRFFDPAEVGPQLDLHQAALNKNQLRLHQALGTLRSLGMSDAEIFKAADGVGLSKDTIRDATNGTRRSWTFAPGWAQKLIANKAKMKEQEAGPVLDAVVEWIRKNPSFYPVVPEDDE